MAAESMEFEDVNLSPPDDKGADIETGQEVSTGISQCQRDQKRKIAVLRVSVGVIVVAAVMLAVGLSVGLTQHADKAATESAPIPTSLLSNLPRPVIIDEDYGAFPDDIFALALALELKDVLDVKAVVGTSMDPFSSALCMAQHLSLAGRNDVKVVVGKDIHDAPFRAGIWVDENLVGFPLRKKCQSALNNANVTATATYQRERRWGNLMSLGDLAQMLRTSDRDDWVYLTLGGMTTIAALTKQHLDAVRSISDVIVMGTNICGNKMIYTGVWSPVQETNVACDPTAANFVFSNEGPGKNLFAMPVGPGQDTIDGEPYQKIIKASQSGCQSAAALLEFYFEWSKQARNDTNILTHGEAKAFDPKVSSALRYDPTCVLFAAQLLTEDDKSDDYVTQVEIPGLWFDHDGYTHVPFELMLADPVSDVCPTLTDLRFDLDNITDRRPLKVATGYTSSKKQDEFLDVMADALSCARGL